MANNLHLRNRPRNREPEILSETLKPARVIFFFLYFLILGCSNNEKVLPEVRLAKEQELNLWKAEAHLYLPQQYAQYKTDFSRANDELLKINAQFYWFRNYKPVKYKFIQLLKQGDELLKRLETEKQGKAGSIIEKINSIQEKIDILNRITLMINEGRLSRSSLTKATVILKETKALYEKGQYIASENKMEDIRHYMDDVEKTLFPVLIRYKNTDQITKWKRWADEAIEASRENKTYSILIIKADKKLLVYKNGKLLKVYSTGLGRNGSLNKIHAGDYATPEGKYRIIRKNTKSRYYKALLIDYPNEEDKKEFHKAKRKGLISNSVGIGDLIEIHGGGRNSVTYGCIALDNGQMEELFKTVGVGTPVTILGALNYQNSISAALIEMQRAHEQKNAP